MQAKKEYIPLIAGMLFLINIFISFREFLADILDIFRFYGWYKITALIPFVTYILFAVFLFIGKKKLLLIPVGIELFSEIYWILMRAFEFGTIGFEGMIYELPYILLLVFIIISCMGKRKILKYIWFLPAVLLAIPCIIQLSYYFNLEGFLNAVAIGFTGYWLTVEENFEEVTATNGYFDMRKHVSLFILTLGIWELVWVYRMTAYLNNADDFEKRTPKNQLLLFALVPFYSVFWYYQSAKRTDKLAEIEGVTSDTSVICLVLSLARYFVSSLIGIASPIIIQNKINKFSPKRVIYEDEELIEE